MEGAADVFPLTQGMLWLADEDVGWLGLYETGAVLFVLRGGRARVRERGGRPWGWPGYRGVSSIGLTAMPASYVTSVTEELC